MYCSNCGKSIPEESKFCKYCGFQIEGKIESVVESVSETLDPSESSHTLEKRRRKSIGFVLIGNSLLGFLDPLLVSMGVYEADATNPSTSVLPSIVDLYLGIQLLRGRDDLLNWVLIRAVIGGVIWSVVAFYKNQPIDGVSQIIFAFYFVLLIKTKLTNGKIKFANLVIIPLVIILLLASGAFAG